MASASGLSESHREQARKVIVRGAKLMVLHAPAVHYAHPSNPSQAAKRWEGISHRLLVSRGQFPMWSDCSSSATWLLWNGIHLPYGVRDVVNGTGWAWGWTGTIADHGKAVKHDKNIKVGDLILYGQAPDYDHVVVSMGGRRVFSHGSEGGPYFLDLDYRDDRGPTRRCI